MAKTILAIDDDQDILEAIQLILTSEGYHNVGISKGEEVYKKVAELHPDLIILDILLSGNDGRTICKNLKEDDKTKRIPIIMISAHPTAKDSVKECGGDGFLAKPFSLDDLINQVKRFIGNA